MAGKTGYKNQWQKDNAERINLTVPIGDKAVIKTHADLMGESVNGFIKRAIRETMERDNEKTVAIYARVATKEQIDT